MDEAARTGSKALGDADSTEADTTDLAGTDSSSSAAASGESGGDNRTPEEIQRDIERTRLELGDTAEALAAKADVKGQAKAKVEEVRETARLKKDETLGKIRDSSPESASSGADSVKAAAQDNPLPFAVGGALILGFLIGRVTRRR